MPCSGQHPVRDPAGRAGDLGTAEGPQAARAGQPVPGPAVLLLRHVRGQPPLAGAPPERRPAIPDRDRPRAPLHVQGQGGHGAHRRGRHRVQRAIISQAYTVLLGQEGVFPVNEGLEPSRITQTLQTMQKYKVLTGTARPSPRSSTRRPSPRSSTNSGRGPAIHDGTDRGPGPGRGPGARAGPARGHARRGAVRPGRHARGRRPVPRPGPDEVLVRVAMCGICGTDLKIFDGHFPQTPPFGDYTPGPRMDRHGGGRRAAGWTSSRPATGCASRRTAAAAVATTA